MGIGAPFVARAHRRLRRHVVIIAAAVSALTNAGCYESWVDLHVDVQGNGSVTDDAQRIDCTSAGGRCLFSSREPATLVVRATPASGATFVGWNVDVGCGGYRCNSNATGATVQTRGDEAIVHLEAATPRPDVYLVAVFQ
jgi:hypothetical protein